MNIGQYFKMCINRIKYRNMLLDKPKDMYDDLISSPKINDIINNMPQSLSEIEKAYYIYIELGKIISYDSKFQFADRKGRDKIYNDLIYDEEYNGICKSMSELYVSVLKRIGIQADSAKLDLKNPHTHVETVLNINGKHYVANLTSDLYRIKTSMRVNSFCYDLYRLSNRDDFKEFLDRLEDYYGKIDVLTRMDIERFDKKLGYSFAPKSLKKYERGIYTEDVIKLLKKDFEDPETFKEYVLKNKDVPEEEILKYKMDYIFENIDKIVDYNSNVNYLENIRFYRYIATKVLPQEELSRIQAYAVTVGDDLSNIISIIKVRNSKIFEKESKNVYYVYSNKDRRYKERTKEEMNQFMDIMNKDSLNIVGTFDKHDPREIDELEL